MESKLNNLWVLWYDKKNTNVDSENWDKFLVRICSFENLEKFCSILGNILPLNQLSNGASYHFFKQGIEPRWEDKFNIHGGKWNLILQKQDLNKADELWLLTLSSIIGGSFESEFAFLITGIVGTIKKGQIRIAIWTKNSTNKNLQLNIGETWKNIIQDSFILEQFVLEFFPHKTHPFKN